MGLEVRLATDADLDAWAGMTRRLRRALATWSPRWWRPSERADYIHPVWLQHLMRTEGPVARAVEADGVVVGACVSLPQPALWNVEDLVVVDGGWPVVGPVLAAAVVERPALTCAAVQDHERQAALGSAGLVPVSEYWISEVDPDQPPLDAFVPPGGAIPPRPAPPPHTFGPAVGPEGSNALLLADEAAVISGASRVMAPPIYDPGGTVCIVDRVEGDRQHGLALATAAAAAHGDVLIAVVGAIDDRPLQGALVERGFQPTVTVLRWPSSPSSPWSRSSARSPDLAR